MARKISSIIILLLTFIALTPIYLLYPDAVRTTSLILTGILIGYHCAKRGIVFSFMLYLVIVTIVMLVHSIGPELSTGLMYVLVMIYAIWMIGRVFWTHYEEQR